MAEVIVTAHIPEELLADWLQTVRDFDMRHDAAHENRVVMGIMVKAEMSEDDFKALIGGMEPPIDGDIISFFPAMA
jgi:3-dehydroquinate synthetase